MPPQLESKKASWADEVEEQDAAARAEKPFEGPAEIVGGKKKNKKKKKKKASHDQDAPLQDRDGKALEECWEKPSVFTSEEALPEASNREAPVAVEEGWEVAASRRLRRNDETQRKQNNYNTNNNNAASVWVKAGSSSNAGMPQMPSRAKNLSGPQPPPQRNPENSSWKMQGRPVIIAANEKWQAESKSKLTAYGQKVSSVPDLQILRTASFECKNDAFYMGPSPDAYTGFAGIGNKPEYSAPQPAVNRWQQPTTYNEEGRNQRTDTTLKAQMFSKLFPSEKQYQEATGTQQAVTAHSVAQNPATLSLGPFPLDDYVHSDANSTDNDLTEDSDSECLASDDFDSEASDVSHETQKRNKWFKVFFDSMELLTLEELNEHQYHCPACKGGVGAIDWYKGLQPLLAHAKTVRAKRVKLHRTFAKVLEEEVEIRGVGPGANGQGIFGKWKGLKEDDEKVNPLIVWPPMVVIQNTKLELDEQEKWIGMGNQELLSMFKDYNAMKARHAYGPQGHRGMSLVIFSDSPAGYIDAQRLDKHFKDSMRGRDEWDRPGKLLFLPGGDRMLYGYIANAEDLEIFNKHSAGKGKLKYRLRHLQEAVFEPMRRMDRENVELNWLKMKVEREKGHSKALEKTMSAVARKLRMKDEEMLIIRKRAMEQHEEYQREMDSLEQTFKEMLNQLASDSARREEVLMKKKENVKQAQIEQCEELEKRHAEISDEKKVDESKQPQEQARMEEEIARQSELVEMSLKDSEEYESQKRELMRKHHVMRVKFRRKQYEEALAFEKELEKEKNKLMDKYLQGQN